MKAKEMKTAMRFAGVFFLLYLVFKKMMVLVHVNMTGWQFIAFIIVLALIVEYIIEKKG
jgi:hypothetical protein